MLYSTHNPSTLISKIILFLSLFIWIFIYFVTIPAMWCAIIWRVHQNRPASASTHTRDTKCTASRTRAAFDCLHCPIRRRTEFESTLSHAICLSQFRCNLYSSRKIKESVREGLTLRFFAYANLSILFIKERFI